MLILRPEPSQWLTSSPACARFGEGVDSGVLRYDR